jgi:hypothetical protein
MKTCSKCKKSKDPSEFGKCNATNPRGAFSDGLTYDCRECRNRTRREWVKTHRESERAASRKYHKANPEFSLWAQAKARAKKRNTSFTITKEDIIIPEFCPVLGIPLFKIGKKVGPNSPSLDCIIPELGYVPGNIVVMSFKANTMKSNASFEEIEQLYLYMKSTV